MIVPPSRLLSIGRDLNIQNAAPTKACRDITAKENAELGIINCLYEAETVIMIIDGYHNTEPVVSKALPSLAA